MKAEKDSLKSALGAIQSFGQGGNGLKARMEAAVTAAREAAVKAEAEKLLDDGKKMLARICATARQGTKDGFVAAIGLIGNRRSTDEATVYNRRALASYFVKRANRPVDAPISDQEFGEVGVDKLETFLQVALTGAAYVEEVAKAIEAENYQAILNGMGWENTQSVTDTLSERFKACAAAYAAAHCPNEWGPNTWTWGCKELQAQATFVAKFIRDMGQMGVEAVGNDQSPATIPMEERKTA